MLNQQNQILPPSPPPLPLALPQNHHNCSPVHFGSEMFTNIIKQQVTHIGINAYEPHVSSTVCFFKYLLPIYSRAGFINSFLCKFRTIIASKFADSKGWQGKPVVRFIQGQSLVACRHIPLLSAKFN